MCPHKLFIYLTSLRSWKCQDADGPKAQPEWAIHGVAAPVNYTLGVKASWMLETIFTPSLILRRHHFVLQNTTWQMRVLSNWTHCAFGELNTQVQQGSEMIPQDRLALDMLIKEHVICGMLNLTDGECCITIHNASISIEEARVKMREDTDKNWDLFQAMQPGD